MSASKSEMLDLLKHVFTISNVIVSAIKDDKPERVDAILPAELKTSLAKAAGEAKMRAKVGV